MQHYCSLPSVWIGKEEGQTREYKVIEARIFKSCFLFILQGIDTVEKASGFMRDLYASSKNLVSLSFNSETLTFSQGKQLFQVEELGGQSGLNVTIEPLGKGS